MKTFQTEFFKTLVHGDSVYTHAYYARISESLEEDFSELVETLGDARWDKISRDFIFSYPSTSWTLAELSLTFFDYLVSDHKLSTSELECARRDLAITKSDLLDRGDASFDLENITSLALVLNPTLVATGNPHEWARETVHGTEVIVLKPAYSALLSELLTMKAPITIQNLPQDPELFHDFIKHEIFIGTSPLKENL